MSIKAALSLLLEEYPIARSQQFKGNSVAQFIRRDFPEIILGHIQSTRYLIKGSAGQSKWARVPWVGIFDSLVTRSAQDGFYVVYLVKEDFSGIYLSLNQGVTSIRERYHSDAKKALRSRAADLGARIGHVPYGFDFGGIDLSCVDNSSLGAFYESGAIYSKYYPRDQLPEDSSLWEDLNSALSMYLGLVDQDSPPSGTVEREDDETHFEDLRKIRYHKRIERNQNLSRKVKKLKGYRCEACGFEFKNKYKEIGDDFIEAHHLTPLAELKGHRISMNPAKDFAVLCSNCHKMIHKTDCVSDINKFKSMYILASDC